MDTKLSYFIKISQENNKRPLDISGESNDIIIAAKSSFRGMILQKLSRVPLLKSLSVISDYVKKINTKNNIILTKFIASLSGEYSNTQLLAAAEIMPTNTGKPFISRHIKIMMDRMESFNGIGAAKTSSNNIQINIWPYKNKNHPGHASLTINKNHQPTTHISWFPEKEGDNKYDSYIKRVEGNIPQDYETDALSELAEKTKLKLAAFDEIREAKKEKSISRTFLDAIDEEIDDTFDIFLEYAEENGKSLFSATNEEQKNILMSLVKDTKNLEKNSTDESDSILEKTQEVFIEVISERLSSMILDQALAYPGGCKKLFTKASEKTQKTFIEDVT